MIKGEADKNRKLYDGVLEQLKKTSLTSGMEFGGFRVVEQALAARFGRQPEAVVESLAGRRAGPGAWYRHRARSRLLGHVGRPPWKRSSTWTCSRCSGRCRLSGCRRPPRHLMARVRRRLPGRRTPTGIALAKDGRVGRNASRLPTAIDLPANPMAAEDVRTICASLLLSRSGRPPRVLLVTSAAPGGRQDDAGDGAGPDTRRHGCGHAAGGLRRPPGPSRQRLRHRRATAD